MATLKGTMSDSTRHGVFRVLNRALNVAVRWERLGRNVCQAVESPKVSEPEMFIMTAAETNQLLEALEGDRLYPLYLTAIYTGMRQGELFGLRWSDIHLDNATAWVRQTLQKPGNNPIFGTPKNNKTRAVPLGPDVVQALKSLRIEHELERAHYGHEYRDYDLVFAQKNGAPLNASSIRKWHWIPLKEGWPA